MLEWVHNKGGFMESWDQFSKYIYIYIYINKTKNIILFKADLLINDLFLQIEIANGVHPFDYDSESFLLYALILHEKAPRLKANRFSKAFQNFVQKW